jgi:hypothetical protein
MTSLPLENQLVLELGCRKLLLSITQDYPNGCCGRRRVEVQELVAFHHAQGLELGDHRQNLHDAQPKLALRPWGGPEESRMYGSQLGAHPDDGVHAKATAGLNHHAELLLLEHDHHVEPHGGRHERKRDVLRHLEKAHG